MSLQTGMSRMLMRTLPVGQCAGSVTCVSVVASQEDDVGLVRLQALDDLVGSLSGACQKARTP